MKKFLFIALIFSFFSANQICCMTGNRSVVKNCNLSVRQRLKLVGIVITSVFIFTCCVVWYSYYVNHLMNDNKNIGVENCNALCELPGDYFIKSSDLYDLSNVLSGLWLNVLRCLNRKNMVAVNCECEGSPMSATAMIEVVQQVCENLILPQLRKFCREYHKFIYGAEL